MKTSLESEISVSGATIATSFTTSNAFVNECSLKRKPWQRLAADHDMNSFPDPCTDF